MTTSRRVPSVKIKLSKRLLEKIEEHHKSCLKLLFRKYYQPLPNGTPDRLWVTRLHPVVNKQVRLHLCVVKFGDVLDWTDEEVGTKILWIYSVIDYEMEP